MDENPKLTYYDIARAVGCTPNYASLVMRGKREPRLEQAKSFADALDVTMDDFFEFWWWQKYGQAEEGGPDE